MTASREHLPGITLSGSEAPEACRGFCPLFLAPSAVTPALFAQPVTFKQMVLLPQRGYLPEGKVFSFVL